MADEGKSERCVRRPFALQLSVFHRRIDSRFERPTALAPGRSKGPSRGSYVRCFGGVAPTRLAAKAPPLQYSQAGKHAPKNSVKPEGRRLFNREAREETDVRRRFASRAQRWKPAERYGG
jgi:hypothetical protein